MNHKQETQLTPARILALLRVVEAGEQLSESARFGIRTSDHVNHLARFRDALAALKETK